MNSHPLHDAAVMFVAFAVGSMFPIVPFFFGDTTNIMLISVSLTIITLFAVGMGKSTVTHRNCFDSGLEIVMVGVGAGAFGYLVGLVFGVLI